MIKQAKLNTLFCSIATAVFLGGFGAAHAGSLNQNIALAGTIAPVPVTCSFDAANVTTININAQAAASMITSSPFYVYFRCNKASFPYSIVAPLEWVPITVGGKVAGAYIETDFGPTLFEAPSSNITFGNGSGRTQLFKIVIGGAAPYSNLDPSTHVGVISGVLPIELQK